MGRNINKFKQKMILVIGASGGLGEVVVGLLSKAHNVLAVYNSTKPKKQCENVRWIQADLRNASEIENIISELKRGDIERVTLINLLAIKEDNLLINHDLDTWNDVLNLNVTSSFYLTKLLLPLMIDKKWGRFIFITSTGGVRGEILFLLGCRNFRLVFLGGGKSCIPILFIILPTVTSRCPA